ncbi:GntR family transcriptional regulator [Streptomyces sp. NPDC055722]
MSYEDVLASLREGIDSGLYDQKLPTGEELAERFDCSRSTVSRALKKLAEDGYLDRKRGRSPKVIPGGSQKRPKEALDQLIMHLQSAFEAEHVTLDVSCMTSETLNNAVNRLNRERIKAKSIAVRLLLPQLDSEQVSLAQRIGDPDDTRPLQRLRELVSSHATITKDCIRRLRTPHRRATIEIRSMPITPVQKVYILNGNNALFGYYDLRRREEEVVEGETMEIYDIQGLSVPLFHFSAARDSGFVDSSKRWFESYWSNLAEPINPSG